MSALFAIILSFLAIFLILLVLVQRGRGGGLAGALGGMGGSSAFGAKAGDIFTRITVVTAAIWIAICLVALFWSKHHGDVLGSSTPATPSGPANLPPIRSDVAPGSSTPPPATSTTPPAKSTTSPAAQTTAPTNTSAPAAPASKAESDKAAPPATKK